MSMEAARTKFSDEFTTLFAAEYPAVPIAYENRKFVQPVNLPWARFSVVETNRKRQNVGAVSSRFNRVKGLIVVELFAPEDTGTKTLFQMADATTTLLEERVFPLSTGRHATTQTGDRQNQGKQANGFYLVTVFVPYWLDEQLPVP